MSSFTIRQVCWNDAAEALKRVRYQVFCCEWRIPETLEFDQHDPVAFHVLVEDEESNPLATGRLLPNGDLGRIAVVIPARGKGIAKAVLNQLLNIARNEQMETVFINSALESIDKFKMQGFLPVTRVFMEAGVPRQRLKCRLGRLTELDQSEQHH
ncbi:GNAT family N-acetyltransferase [Corallincola platygyrae]|uniref:GNAT family N-acetyltransferase n=1 Tax=Corallincola platygyrae TaxID=1193278 RepID=A0ABW4XHY0_9GAMM